MSPYEYISLVLIITGDALMIILAIFMCKDEILDAIKKGKS